MQATQIIGAQRRKFQRHVARQAQDSIAVGNVVQPSRARDAVADP